MSNLIACLFFNIVGLGSSYFLSLLTGEKNTSEKLGTSIFWGFWVSMLFTYVLWLVIPNNLAVACYITALISTIGVGLLLRREGIKAFLKSEYLIALLILSPFIFIAKYTPGGWDEFSLWLMAPKTFFHQQGSVFFGASPYTPLWTLHAAFFQFFTLSDFSEAVIYAVRINFFLAFIFFIKELSKARFLTVLLLTSSIFFLFAKFYWYHISVLTIEFPVYILLTSILFLVGSLERNQLKTTQENVIFLLVAILSAYMIKKSLIAVLPAGVFILWINGYRKQLFYLLLAFAAFYYSWNSVVSEGASYSYKVNSDLWSPKAMKVYQELITQSLNLKISIISFIISMAIIFWKNKNVFMFYLIFSSTYFVGLIFTYIYVFDDYESSILASYERYLADLFVPVFIYALYIVFSKAQKYIDVEKHILKHSLVVNCVGALLISGVVGGYFYKTSSANETSPIGEYYLRIKNLYTKVKSLDGVKDKACLAIWQGGNNIQQYITGYIGYGELSKVQGGSFAPHKDNYWRTAVHNEVEFFDNLKNEYDILLIVESDDWLNRIFLKSTNINTEGLKDFALVKRENNYEIIRSE